MPAETHTLADAPDTAAVVELLASLLGIDPDGAADVRLRDVDAENDLAILDLWTAVVEEYGERCGGELDLDVDDAKPSTVGELATAFLGGVDRNPAIMAASSAEGDWRTGPRVGDVQAGVPAPVVIDGHRFVIIRIEDDFYALGDRCTHTGESLAEVGEIDGTEIECTAHGARFDVASGEATCLPATRPLPVAEVRAVDGYVQYRLANDERSRR